MEELKPCPIKNLDVALLPCNLERLNERILNLGAGIAQMEEQDTIRVHKNFLVATLGYMDELLGMRREEENRRAAPENKPLTLEQLREMDGEPVWTVPLDGTGCGEWTIIAIGAQIEMLKALSPDTAYEECNYGKTWLAYARKPEK